MRDRDGRLAGGLMAAALCAVLTGCGGGPQLPPVSSLTASVGPATSETADIAEPAAEVYLRIARAANQCWFGPEGAIARSYVFYADAERDDQGGTADIVIHERIVGEIRPWGLKAFRINMAVRGGFTTVSTTNLKVPPELAARLHADVMAWARGQESCRAREGMEPAVQATPPQAAPRSPATDIVTPKAGTGPGKPAPAARS